jgi:hypothetical protein
MKPVLTVHSHIRGVAHLTHAVRRSAPVDTTILNLDVTDIHVTDDVTMKSHVLANNKPAVKKNAGH